MVVRAKKMIDVGTVRLCGCVREWVSVWVRRRVYVIMGVWMCELVRFKQRMLILAQV
jgi:hypothetical protein